MKDKQPQLLVKEASSSRLSSLRHSPDKGSAFMILALVIMAYILMGLIDGWLIRHYAIKSFLKACLFLGFPSLFFVLRKKPLPLAILMPNIAQLRYSLGLGLFVFVFILASYALLGSFFDFSSVVSALETNVGVTKDNFIYVSLYISLINSLLEEVFFRGFAFLVLQQYTTKRFACMSSAIFFALYHVAIMRDWFDFLLFGLLIVGLLIGGLLFNYLDDKLDSIYPSWFVHMFANVAINFIGFSLFGLL